jgi:phosphoribosylformimino-5-aminoimidazole carboxamide ribotide isomerase
VEHGAPIVHLVDFDGAIRGWPANLEAIGAVASAVAAPLQVAGGVDSANAIRLAFAVGATRVVVGLALADDPVALADCLDVAGDWLGVGLDARPERLNAFPWRRPRIPTILEIADELVGRGVRRLVLGHGGGDQEMATLARLATSVDADLLVAGGVHDLDGIRRVRDTGASGIILGEALLSGAIDYTAAREAAA